jgi:hypothetical protein
MIIQNILGVWYVSYRKHKTITRAGTLEKALEQALLKALYIFK